MDREQFLDEAVRQWGIGNYYDAHEALEDFAELIDDNELPIALALIQVAACLHKIQHKVGKSAVPGKLMRALKALETAPAVWCGLDLDALRTALVPLRDQVDAEPVELPRLLRA